MKEFWNQRYQPDVYIYGTEPNQFLKESIRLLKPGRILFPGEGEGRNAVFAAQQGWEVSAFDSAAMGKKKAIRLAERFGVFIDYQVSDANDIVLKDDYYDCLALIYIHVSKDNRVLFHRKMLQCLKPGGRVILEGFEKKQLQNDTGGPKSEGMLFSTSELRAEFEPYMAEMRLEEMEITIEEGTFHSGRAQVVRLLGIKK